MISHIFVHKVVTGLYFSSNFDDSDIVTVKRKKNSFALLKLITSGISYRFNTPGFEEQMKARVSSIAYIKLDDKDICENEAITNEYNSSMSKSYSNKYINNYPTVKSFLNDALNQQIEELLPCMGQHGFDNMYLLSSMYALSHLSNV